MLDVHMLATINADGPAYFRAYLDENPVALQRRA
jgi:hypothetical protein